MSEHPREKTSPPFEPKREQFVLSVGEQCLSLLYVHAWCVAPSGAEVVGLPLCVITKKKKKKDVQLFCLNKKHCFDQKRF